MHVKIKRGWELPESAATPEEIFHQRRTLAKTIAAGPILAAAAPMLTALPAWARDEDPTADLYPVARNERYVLDRELTEEGLATNYNNFYEFGSHKRIAKAARKLEIRPWTVTIDGMVEQEMVVDIDDLIRSMPLEERVYRHRCVEAWSMAVPWSGFQMSALLDMAKPLGSAKYVRMETAAEKKSMTGLRQFWYPWPYIEGLTVAEAANELSFLVTGLYGKPVPKQNGAPLRLVVPWKYGFKSIKSIVRFTFTDERPKTFWEAIQPNEYGFWANVNPEVSHPRWSQAEERLLGVDGKVPTLLYNGYAEFVAGLYENTPTDRLFI